MHAGESNLCSLNNEDLSLQQYIGLLRRRREEYTFLNFNYAWTIVVPDGSNSTEARAGTVGCAIEICLQRKAGRELYSSNVMSVRYVDLENLITNNIGIGLPFTWNGKKTRTSQ